MWFKSFILIQIYFSFFYICMQKRAIEAEHETQEVYKQINQLKRKYEEEISNFNQLLADSNLPKSVDHPVYDDEPGTHIGGIVEQSACDQKWREEFESYYKSEEEELSKFGEPPSSWFSGYDRCNI